MIGGCWSGGVALNVMAFEEMVSEEVKKLGSEEGIAEAVDELVELFRHARTFGSLIQVPEGLAAKLPALRRLREQETGDLFVAEGLRQLRTLVRQEELLARKYDAVVANLPYMGAKYYCQLLSDFIDQTYPTAKPDIYACFMLASLDLCGSSGRIANINIPGWMINSPFEEFRTYFLRRCTGTNYLIYNALFSAHGAIF